MPKINFPLYDLVEKEKRQKYLCRQNIKEKTEFVHF